MPLRKKIIRALPYLLVAAAYVLSVVFFALYGAHNINADDASEMILAQKLNEEGTFLSENWLYSTELRVISPVPLYQLGLRLFPTWHMARTFAISIVLMIVVLSGMFMMRKLGLKKSAPWFAAMLALPFSGTYGYIVVYGCYYAIHLSLAFIMLGLLCDFGRRGMKKGKVQLALLCLLALISGLGGVRMMTMFIAPLIAASALLAVWEAKKEEHLSAVAHQPQARIFGACVGIAAFSAVGFWVNEVILPRKYQYFTYSDMTVGRFELSDVLHQFSGIIRDLGYREGESFFSPGGIGALISIAVAVLMLLALVRLLTRWKEISPEIRILTVTSVVAIALGMVLNIMLIQWLTRYFLVGTILLIAAMFACLETEPCKNAHIRTCALILLTGCFAFQAQNVLRYDYTCGEVNYEIAADWLLENGYTQGYATFWNANTLTEASDGKIEMWVLEDGRLNSWMYMVQSSILQAKDHLTRDPEGKVFLLVDEEQNKIDSPLMDEDHLIGEMVAWSYYIYGYDSADEMRALLAE